MNNQVEELFRGKTVRQGNMTTKVIDNCDGDGDGDGVWGWGWARGVGIGGREGDTTITVSLVSWN